MYCVKILSTEEILFTGSKEECWQYIDANQEAVEKTLYVTKVDVKY